MPFDDQSYNYNIFLDMERTCEFVFKKYRNPHFLKKYHTFQIKFPLPKVNLM